MRKLQTILLLLACVALLQCVFYYPRLPDTLASNFDWAGSPNGWSSKWAFFTIYLGIILWTLLAFIFLPVFLLDPCKASLSIPNKDYWLAPDRREQTFSFVRASLLWFGVASMALALGVVELVLRANLRSPPVLPPIFLYMLGIYGFFVIFWLGRLLGKFRRTPGA